MGDGSPLVVLRRWNMRQAPDELYEKRWSRRRYAILPIHCELSGKEESGMGWLRDFSNTGASLISNLSLMAGDELIFTLPKEGQPDIRIAATVRWKHGPLLGVEFTHTPRN